MAKISDITEAKIKEKMRIEHVLTDQGVELQRCGADYVALCPFHDDQTMGSFKVSPVKNICTCYSCNTGGLNPIDALIRLKYKSLDKKEAYKQALRYLAAMYDIPVDEEDAPSLDHKVPSLPTTPKLDVQLFPPSLMKPYLRYNDSNPLLKYLTGLPLMDVDMERLNKAIVNYIVGTYPTDKMKGWTIWWYVDAAGYMRTGKLMAYKPDGHRDKDVNSTWAHSLMQRWKTRRDGTEYEQPNWKWDNHEKRYDICLFGLHLLNLFPKAVIRIVESEKTAVFCSAFTDMQEVIWMASGGLQMLTDEKLMYLMEKGRMVELYPDYDGYGSWTDKVMRTGRLLKYLRSQQLVISPVVKDLWKPEDGPKADIMDIMVRIVNTPKKSEEEKTYEMVCAKLGVQEHEGLRDMIYNLGLTLT